MMASIDSETLPITVIGANDRLRDTIELFFKGPCEGRYILCREHDASMTIADLDAVGGLDLLESHRQRSPHLPIIALTVRDLDLDGVQVLRKPIQTAVLEKAIEICRKTFRGPDLAESTLSPVSERGAGSCAGKPSPSH